MARGANATSASSDKVSTDYPTDSTWNGSPMEFARFFYNNKDTLFEDVDGAEEYFKYGLVTHTRTGKVSGYSIHHVQAYIDKSIAVGNIDAPVDAIGLYENTAAQAIAVKQPSTTAKDGTVTPGVSVNAIPTRLSDLGPRADRFQEAPEVCDKLSNYSVRHWTDKITNDKTKSTWVRDCQGNIHTFLRLAKVQLTKSSSARDAARGVTLSAIDGLINTGFTTASVSNYVEVTGAIERLNRTIVQSVKHKDEDELEVCYDEMIERTLGDKVYNKIIQERNRIESHNATQTPKISHTPLEMFNEACMLTFGRNDGNAAKQANLEGRANYVAAGDGSDAKRFSGAPQTGGGDQKKHKAGDKKKKGAWKPPTSWAEPMRGCRILLADKTTVCNGNHLDADHDKPGSTPKAATGTAKLAAGGTTDDAKLSESLFGGLGGDFDLSALNTNSTHQEAIAALSVGTARACAVHAADATDGQIELFLLVGGPPEMRGILSGNYMADVLPMLRDTLEGSDAELTDFVRQADSMSHAIEQ